jgi:mRNA interferase RelE/StbE
MLRRLSLTDRERISRGIDALPTGDVRKLKGVEEIWRLRVGDWRVLFSLDHDARVIDVLAVRPRGRAYD